MMVRNTKDLLSGLFFVACGAFFVLVGQDYTFGSARRMGPGYFPTVLGVLLAILGVVVMARAVKMVPKKDEGEWAWRALAINCVGIVIFGVIVRGAGLIPAVFILAMVSAWASTKFRMLPSLLLATGLAVFSHFTFVKGLGLPFPPFGTWFGY